MLLSGDTNKPIYVQIADWLEGEIVTGSFQVDDKIYSQYQLAEMFTVNPATAAKGLTLLLEDDILYKKRGLGMFVADHAAIRIQTKRREGSLMRLIEQLLTEANQLGVSKKELMELIETMMQEREEGPK
ncbi:transcriptional regulator, GntR family [Bacillus sp. JCM 19046]|uniref:DNA-binding transcriptional regulator YhcF (GntR family) n=1 Tax=Shouchella xiaoxiensis TaxID=766895 RepID=A0ABS2SZP4_9BACI|nr:DNA-binding transcriptional regulator YhcF (GntR family) [Shouchella xiaoxiensis]GAF14126.1 transcriptional regulator, GntR family [Bacillus sp. JCM 19045]GAF19314.1 transcriptional regulator, GntR family [Bacillus sp. JCM 19046]